MLSPKEQEGTLRPVEGHALVFATGHVTLDHVDERIGADRLANDLRERAVVPVMVIVPPRERVVERYTSESGLVGTATEQLLASQDAVRVPQAAVTNLRPDPYIGPFIGRAVWTRIRRPYDAVARIGVLEPEAASKQA